MALSRDELNSLLIDLTYQYEQLSREYSETVNPERRIELSDIMASVEYRSQVLKNNSANF